MKAKKILIEIILGLVVFIVLLWVIATLASPPRVFLPLMTIVGVYIFPVIVNRKLAIKKGRNLTGWIIAVFLLSWWSTLILACLPSKLTEAETAQMQSNEQLKSDLREFRK